MNLGTDEQAKMDQFYGPKDKKTPLAPGRVTNIDLRTLQEQIMTNRHQALRHVWDVAVGPHFLSDCMALPADVHECVVANIAVLARPVCPEAT